MIDIHTHILPGLDDGAANLQEAIALAAAAVDGGITYVIATPHCLNGLYHNEPERILEACRKLNSVLKEEKIPLTILPGAEIHLSPEVATELDTGNLMTLNNDGKHILLELPDHFTLNTITRVLTLLNSRSITPIIAHPERNLTIQHNIDVVGELHNEGALTQITAASIWGTFGPEVMDCCQTLLRRGWVHFVASDAHSFSCRAPDRQRTMHHLTELVGFKQADWILREAPQRLLQGLPVTAPEFEKAGPDETHATRQADPTATVSARTFISPTEPSFKFVSNAKMKLQKLSRLFTRSPGIDSKGTTG